VLTIVQFLAKMAGAVPMGFECGRSERSEKNFGHPEPVPSIPEGRAPVLAAACVMAG